ncbi:3-hydroxyacyl-CoA dehydrogenase family protein [Epidermidibacterium keratini]|uniref:3-hydroxyacyl-CoA dehydrogenase family protein n=1 Tax=Epidermidibacterium keratini TaxID=1891644 RepID=A0A7L4YRM5_9ACTN|nr:3-hydroxybutyryl-CoA dehydrogenase [Epidermidibacterium keratini]QHC01722.1 3-hydroxyacyl-CoA dehydrogenase family protein [Epidermidibacterium keratini]
MARDFSVVGVVGLGTMGAGIAEVFARSGIDVVAFERDDEGLERGKGFVERSIERGVARGKLEQPEADAIHERVQYTTSWDDFARCELVIEAVPEQMDIKLEIFDRLDSICQPDTILATNTSSLSVTEIAVATARPSKVVGMHFFNPAPIMELVEVITTVVTDQSVVEDIEALCKKIGKIDVTVADKAGFIANALLFGYLNHAVGMFEDNYASREDIDAAMRYGCGLPMGPLALMDLIGMDTAYEILDTMYRQGRNRMHAPRPLIKQMATAGLKGRKSGRGFYTYEGPGSPKLVEDRLTPKPDADPSAKVDVTGKKIGVVGSGTMATGIVEVFAKAGFDTTYVARSQEKADGVRAAITKSLEKAVGRGKLTEDARDAALGKLTGATELDALADCDVVVEAIAEELGIKQVLFANLDEIVKDGAILATTTSSLPVIDLATQTERPEKVIGIHFFNPAPIMKLVEVVHTIATDDDTQAQTLALVKAIGKHPVTCADRAGFIVNALLFPYLNDAIKMVEANYATADDIDIAMKVGCGYPMGPFELLDTVGLDVSLAIEQTLFREFREQGMAPAPLLEHLVTAGFLGRKSKKGFRDYRK